MKKFLIILTGWLCVGGLAPSACALEADPARWRVTWEPSFGISAYEEDTGSGSSRILSDWDAFIYGGRLGVDNHASSEEGIRGRFSLDTFASATATETWTVGGAKYQTNDMDLWGISPGLEAGYAFLLDDESQSQLIPSVGYEFRYLKFSRTNFNILNIITSRDVVTESYQIHLSWAGMRGIHRLGSDWRLEGATLAGLVFDNAADNSSLGVVDGHGGWIFRTEANLQRTWESWTLGLGGFFDHQRLEGGSKSGVIWPDNELDAYGGRAVLTYRW